MTHTPPILALPTVVCAALALATILALPAAAQQPLPAGGVLTGELHAMRNRDATGKRVNSFQLVSTPRRLPGPNGLCNLETGPETFRIVAATDAETKQLKGLVGKTVSIRANEVACAEVAGEMSDAIVSKWSLTTGTN